MAADDAPLVAAVDDAAYGEQLLDWLLALAAGLQRPLLLVYVESAAALGAAALPSSQVLPHGGARWQPLRRDDVELGFRAQAARLQAALARAAQAGAPHAGLRVLRGSLIDTSERLWTETNLLVLASAPWVTAAPTAALRGRPPRVALLPDGDGDGAQARAARVAARLAQALGGEPAAEWEAGPRASVRRGAMARPDLLVLARGALDRALLRRGPLLLVA